MIAMIFNNTLASDECAITKAYKDARIEVFKAIREPYNNCRDSMREAYYWKAVAKCVSEGKGKNIGGGCGHLVSSGSYRTEKYDMSHCDIFKWDKSDFNNYFEHLIETREIEKCEQAGQVNEHE